MFNTTVVNVNDEFDFRDLRGTNMKIVSVESERNKGFTYLVKVEKKIETVICHLSEEEWKEVQDSFKITDAFKLKVIGDSNSTKNDNIVITYEITDKNGKPKNLNNIYEFDAEEEDEEYDDEDVKEGELVDEEDSRFEDESDMDDIANDLWKDCQDAFTEQDKEFLNKKRKLS
jgi:hypothetical protein